MSLLCAFIVVLQHVPSGCLEGEWWWLPRIVTNGLCGIAVPFFFFASGFFFASRTEGRGWWLREVGKRCKSLLVPYLVFAVGYAAVLAASTLLGCGEANLQEVLNPISVLGLDPRGMPLLRPLWFVRSIFLLVLASPVVVALLRMRHGIGSTLLLIVGLCGFDVLVRLGLPKTWNGLFLTGMLSLQALLYFSMGMLFRMHDGWLPWLRAHRIEVLIVTCLVWALRLAAWENSYTANQLVVLLAQTGGFFSGLFFCESIGFPSALLSTAFPVYLLHRYWMLPLRYLLKTMTGNQSPTNGVEFILLWFAVSLSTLATVLLVRKHLPRAASIAFGGR